MASSAFKSTSKRGGFGNTHPSSSSNATSFTSREGNNNPEDLSKKIGHRRSRSVSAVSRSCTLSNVVDFSNKRDNPLFCSTSSSPSPPDLIEPEVTKFDQKTSKFNTSPAKSEGNFVSDSRRGRSVLRNSECGNQVVGARKEIGRSLSRVDTGRRQRSLSRGRHESSEVWGQSVSNTECGIQALGARKDRSSSRVDTGRRQRSLSRGLCESSEKKINVSASASDLSRGARTLQKWSSQHPLSEPSDGFASPMQATNWEDAISTGSLSEAEEKTIKAVSEQMKSFQGDHPPGDAGTGGIYETVRSEVRRAISEIQNDLEKVIQRKNPTIIATSNVADIPPELVNPDAIELVSEIRRDYAVKLKQSQERARKLRADLAVEEHRGQELSRILAEILPEPKSIETQRSRPRRKNSVERWKMSKRLTEEAMNYFDECVSISTFDSSDFSSPEDLPVSLSAAAPPVGDSKFLSSTCSSASENYCINGQVNLNKESDNQVQSILSHEALDLTASSSSKDSIREQENLESRGTEAQPRNLQFSFAHEATTTEPVGIHDDIRNYIKKFEKEIRKDGNDTKVVKSSCYDEEDYELQSLNERLLFEKVILKSRIETGGLHLCGTGVTF